MSNKHPKVVATYIDNYGTVRRIHRNRKNRLAVARLRSTPVLALNRAAAELMGARIRAMRRRRGLTLAELAKAAGMVSGNPKSRMWEIENNVRREGVRLGTLYALALVLECGIEELLPSKEEVHRKSPVTFREQPTLEMPKDDPYNLQEENGRETA